MMIGDKRGIILSKDLYEVIRILFLNCRDARFQERHHDAEMGSFSN